MVSSRRHGVQKPQRGQRPERACQARPAGKDRAMSQASVTRRRAVGFFAVVLASLGSPTWAPAAPARERDPGSAAGQAALAEKQYERARTLFADAYRQSGNRALLCRVAE